MSVLVATGFTTGLASLMVGDLVALDARKAGRACSAASRPRRDVFPRLHQPDQRDVARDRHRCAQDRQDHRRLTGPRRLVEAGRFRVIERPVQRSKGRFRPRRKLVPGPVEEPVQPRLGPTPCVARPGRSRSGIGRGAAGVGGRAGQTAGEAGADVANPTDPVDIGRLGSCDRSQAIEGRDEVRQIDRIRECRLLERPAITSPVSPTTRSAERLPARVRDELGLPGPGPPCRRTRPPASRRSTRRTQAD